MVDLKIIDFYYLTFFSSPLKMVDLKIIDFYYLT